MASTRQNEMIRWIDAGPASVIELWLLWIWPTDIWPDWVTEDWPPVAPAADRKKILSWSRLVRAIAADHDLKMTWPRGLDWALIGPRPISASIAPHAYEVGLLRLSLSIFAKKNTTEHQLRRAGIVGAVPDLVVDETAIELERGPKKTEKMKQKISALRRSMIDGAAWSRVAIVVSDEILINRWRALIGGDSRFFLVTASEVWERGMAALTAEATTTERGERLAEFFEKKDMK